MIDGSRIDFYAVALQEVGAAARRLIPDLVYSTLLANGNLADGKAIFHADRSNVGTPALSDTSLDAALAAVGNQVGADDRGDPVHLGLWPKFLTVPPDLFGLAKRLARAMATGQGDLSVRAESRLGAAGVVDPEREVVATGLATNWLLSCPADAGPGVVLGALNGRVEPSIRHYALGAGEWGIGFDVVLDLACTVAGPRSLYFSNGTT